jgi:1-acyl-sn-glycerol-3-phosphate acyltransferase
LKPGPRHIASEIILRSAIVPIVRGLWRTRVVSGLEYLESGSCFLYGNHSNNFDPFLVNWPLPLGKASSGVLTAEYMQAGLTAAVFRNMGLLSTRKRVPEPHLVGRILRLLRDGRNVLIYPEGGRRWDGRPARWIPSTAKLFARAGYPVHPVLTHGSYVAWPRWADWPRPARIAVEILPAVDLTEVADTEEAVRRLAEPMDIDENIPPEHVLPRRAFRPADGIHRLIYRDPRTGTPDALFTTDGHRIHSRDGGLDWLMMPDSRIMDRSTGELLLTGDLYGQARSRISYAAGGLVTSSMVMMRRGSGLGSLSARALTRASLHKDHIMLTGPVNTTYLDLSDVLFVGIERNYKLQLTGRDWLVELAFHDGGSALHWEDALFTLKAEGA